MLHALYLLGIAAFAASGVFAAHRADMDPFGGLVLALRPAAIFRDLHLPRLRRVPG
ncbi:TRIC cation channel family protein [Streptomyces yangpuensis]|uniref:TRIC cation channel family protein n=1 Tax=Streptomyces yangpuensis TaxID=1648182 RepID=UPI0037137BB6